jgi:hypothetical protein
VTDSFDDFGPYISVPLQNAFGRSDKLSISNYDFNKDMATFISLLIARNTMLGKCIKVDNYYHKKWLPKMSGNYISEPYVSDFVDSAMFDHERFYDCVIANNGGFDPVFVFINCPNKGDLINNYHRSKKRFLYWKKDHISYSQLKSSLGKAYYIVVDMHIEYSGDIYEVDLQDTHKEKKLDEFLSSNTVRAFRNRILRDTKCLYFTYTYRPVSRLAYLMQRES